MRLWSLDESAPIVQFGSASLLALPTFFALRISELLNKVMLLFLQMQPTLSHGPQRLLARSFGQTARPKASPKSLQDSRPRSAFFTQMLEGFGPRPTWLCTDSGPRPECFPPPTGTSKHIFAQVLAGFRSTALLLPHISIILAGFRRPRSKVWKVAATLGFMTEKTLSRQMDAKRPTHPGSTPTEKPPPPPGSPVLIGSGNCFL